MKIIIISTLLFFASSLGFAQNNGDVNKDSKSDVFSKVYSTHEYMEDLNEFAIVLTETHPHPYEFISKENFWKTVEEKKKLINDTTTYTLFMWYCSEIIANLGCSHSGLGWFNQEDKILPISLRFPAEVRLVEKRLYISDPLVNKVKLNAGTEVFSINGISVEVLLDNIFKHINSQAGIETYKTLLFNAYSTAYIPYVLGFPEKYRILIKGKNEATVLNPLQNYKPKPRYNRIISDNLCQEELCFRTQEDKNLAVLTIKSFAYYGDRFSTFKYFITESFKKLQSMNVKNLVIDLRFNGGGPSSAGAYLLQHIFNEPFTYFVKGTKFHDDLTKPIELMGSAFKGKIYVLMDGDGHSTTGHVISLIKDSDRAVLIGEELGSNQFCTANQERGLKLKNTGMTYQVATTAFSTTAQRFPKDKGIYPDHHIIQSMDDFLNGIDTVMEYAIRLVEEN